MLIAAALLTLLMVPVSMGARPAVAQITYTSCFPGCTPDDGKFAVIASGSGYSTLAREPLSFFLTTTQPQLNFGIFDPDISGLWDYFGSQPGNVDFRLYADPFRSGNPGSSMGQVGAWSSTSLAGSDNAWFNISINPNNVLAFNGTEYVYLLVADQTDAAAISMNPFKVGVGSGDGLELVPNVTFGFIGAAAKEADLFALYPNWPSDLANSTYDGEWTFNLNVPAPGGTLDEVSLWDGDLDYGDGTALDSDDVDSGNMVPGFNTSPDAVAQGAQGVGAPKENNGFLFQGLPVFLRGNPVTYELVDPNGVHYVNSNPSGNREWEQFRIRTTTNPLGCDPDGVADGNALDDSDVCVASLTPGTWQLHVMGVDLTNLNFFRFSYAALGGSSPSQINGFVYEDANQDGVFDATETGLAGVQVTLSGTDTFGNSVSKTTVTDSNGFYEFIDLPPGTYTVTETDLLNYVSVSATPGSAGGTASTDFNTISNVALPPGQTAANNNFGDLLTIGDYVWSDTNADGIQNDGDQAGINGVVVQLLDSTGATVVDTTTTLNNPTTGLPGWYQFRVAQGDYIVKIADSNFAANGVLEGAQASPQDQGTDDTVDSDGDPTTHQSGTVTVTPNPTRDDVDFGFLTGSSMCVPAGSSGTKQVGSLFWTVDSSTGDVYVRYAQSLDLNDNSYGANTIGWPGNNHKFDHLVKSDKARFQLKDANGNVVLDFEMDYLDTDANAPSGFASQGASGHEGSVLAGNGAWILDWETSLDRNLNATGLCSGGNCTVNGVNLLVDSPPADANYNVLNSAFSQWDFTNWYWVHISSAAFGTAGFGSVSVPDVHNSPAKDGSKLIHPGPCDSGGGGGGQCDVSGGDLSFHDKEVRWPITNNGSDPVTINKIVITWPNSNGKLKEVKLDGDKIFDKDRNPPSTTIDSDWKGGSDKRTLGPGETKTLTFKFEHDASHDQMTMKFPLSGDDGGGDSSDGYTIRVEFEEGCSVEHTGTSGGGGGTFQCQKPIDSITMKWDGIQPSSLQSVGVKAWKGAPGSALLFSQATVNVGDSVTVNGYAGSPNDVIWEIFQGGSFNTKLGESMFHLSCSDPDMNGPEDCGKREGDGKKNNAGKINDWLLGGMTDSQTSFVCTP